MARARTVRNSVKLAGCWLTRATRLRVAACSARTVEQLAIEFLDDDNSGTQRFLLPYIQVEAPQASMRAFASSIRARSRTGSRASTTTSSSVAMSARRRRASSCAICSRRPPRLDRERTIPPASPTRPSMRWSRRSSPPSRASSSPPAARSTGCSAPRTVGCRSGTARRTGSPTGICSGSRRSPNTDWVHRGPGGSTKPRPLSSA